MTTSQMVPRISRRGFGGAPQEIRDKANSIVAEMVRADSFAERALAELRPTSYCGPGSAGDRGAWTLAYSIIRGQGLRPVSGMAHVYPSA